MSIQAEIEAPGIARAAITIWVEPQDDINLLGVMVNDASLMLGKLKTLPYAAEGYRGDLRVILGAAERMRSRCARLLGEASEPPPAKKRK